MSDSSAIGMVGESLVNLLEGEMQSTPSVDVTVLAPDENAQGNRRINLFLYKVEENTYLKNKEWEVSRTNSEQITAAPLSLNLHYLMTAYAQNDQQTGNTSAHEVLGEAMRVMNEFPIIPGSYLVSGLNDAREQVKIMLKTTDIDEISKIWTTFSEPYRLTVPYEVSVVQLDQSPATTRDIPTRVATLGIPTVTPEFIAPSINAMAPQSGPVSTTITFSGENIDGLAAYVTIGGRRIADQQVISSNSFDVTVPSDMIQGFHQVRVDVSHLYRTTFLFEVTA
ncbi:IPT/TIG domain-containing protein [Nitrosomonas marina]|uniref:IPT/TIG domain-containing protein n=1 Tax=Nitrosomonas marina TaxID=917 RepID=A0A1I0F2E4_9PROT|nr:DUF4255 domain-containing protein [Nitrosomonas marina]SET51546.1 IPT/TIG domain-containing protein [Nitrosomonas marina]